MLGLHKASFVVWVVACGIHVLAYALRTVRELFAERVGGGLLRTGLVVVALGVGVAVAVATYPLAGPSERVARDSRRVVAAQELERRRLARELHDETGPALTSILLGLAASRERRRAQRKPVLPRGASSEASSSRRSRACADWPSSLRPSALDDFGLSSRRCGASATTVRRGRATLDVQVEQSMVPCACPRDVEPPRSTASSRRP